MSLSWADIEDEEDEKLELEKKYIEKNLEHHVVPLVVSSMSVGGKSGTPVKNIINEKDVDDGWRVVKKKKKRNNNNKCYTCNPRRKVNEHLIDTIDGVAFHHDLCNRDDIIIASPDRHFSSFSEVSKFDIGKIFMSIHKFCVNWKIEDYSVEYNQGDWQKMTHFHVKIKTYRLIVKRMKGDHFLLIKKQKEYNLK